MFDKKKRKWFKIRINKDSSIRNKSKVKKNNYYNKTNDFNIIHLRNISQVSSFIDKGRERLVMVQPVIILWDNLVLILIKKILRELKNDYITNNNQCKPIKKGKIKLVKKLLVINDNKNKVNDEKEEIKTYFFHKCLLVLKQWFMSKTI